MPCALARAWVGREVRVGLSLVCPQEEESPCGEVTLKRDRSFSEHDLVQLRSEALAGRQPAARPPGAPEPWRARVGSVHSWQSCAQPGKCCLAPSPSCGSPAFPSRQHPEGTELVLHEGV